MVRVPLAATVARLSSVASALSTHRQGPEDQVGDAMPLVADEATAVATRRDARPY
jgi:hypothetical protein